jgi:hypothetical protein
VYLQPDELHEEPGGDNGAGVAMLPRAEATVVEMDPPGSGRRFTTESTEV